jgi:hypothetical protein
MSEGMVRKGGIEMTTSVKMVTPGKTLEASGKKAPAIKHDRELKGKDAILAVLDRTADDTDFRARMMDNPAEALAEYYALTQEEKAALASGDLIKIEGWVGKLDQRLATWLWCRLSQEKW